MSIDETGAYQPIGSYAIIGDCRCAALISREGSLDWLCLPRFDSPSFFAALLDADRGGTFRIRPAGRWSVHRRYVGETVVLETTFRTETGVLQMTDLMPIYSSKERQRELVPQRHVIRRLKCLEGNVTIEVCYAPRPDYARLTPKLVLRGALGIACQHRGQIVFLRTDLPLKLSEDESRAEGTFRMRQGERRSFSLVFAEADPAVLPMLGEAEDEQIETTIQWWEQWAARCTYQGPYRDSVLRSLLTLKLLTYAPSGAVIAAPTTSLPEKMGGVRNWDYRYCWLRDASMTIRALLSLGYMDEGEAFLSWMLHSTRLTWPKLQVLYDVYGESHIPEEELPHLEGYAQSRPVRRGNAAAVQLQLDVYGEVINAAYEFIRRSGRSLDQITRQMLVGLGRHVCQVWRQPDEGIWEPRTARCHHTHSKVLCWVALDRLLKLHEAGHLHVPAQRFAREREALQTDLETRGYNAAVESYVSVYGEQSVDASLLLLPIYGYRKAEDPRVKRTFARVFDELGRGGFLYRYVYRDGLPPGEGAFAVASFWAVECLARRGELDAARRAFESLLAYDNDVGLFAEEFEVPSGIPLGNFPQAYSHVGLINAALTLVECGQPSDRTSDSDATKEGTFMEPDAGS